MTEAALRAYLLGKLTESEVEQVEVRLVEDPDFFAQMESAEDDLLDAFARGNLDADDRAKFVERFGADSRRLRFAKALAQRTTSRKVMPFVRRPWVGLAAAAALIIVVGTVVVQRETPVAPDAPAAPVAPAAPDALVAPVAPVAPASRATFSLGSSRAASGPAKVVVASDAVRVDLGIRLNPADRFRAYAVEIRSQANNIVWGQAVQSATEGGDLFVHALVPADRLPDGTYEIAVRGGGNAGVLEDLGFATIEVSRIK
jgi:hypothetical protein